MKGFEIIIYDTCGIGGEINSNKIDIIFKTKEDAQNYVYNKIDLKMIEKYKIREIEENNKEYTTYKGLFPILKEYFMTDIFQYHIFDNGEIHFFTDEMELKYNWLLDRFDLKYIKNKCFEIE